MNLVQPQQQQQQMPQNIDAERSVLGGILVHQKAFDEVATVLRPDDFYHPAHESIFEAMCELNLASKPIDAVTLYAHMTSKGTASKLNSSGKAVYLAELMDCVVTVENIVYHAKIVASKAARRKVMALSRGLVSLAMDEETDDQEFFAQVEKHNLEAQSAQKSSAKVVHLSTVLKQVRSEIERRYEVRDSDQPTGVPTGFAHLDGMTSGLQNGDFIVIAGRPSMGKSAFALNVCAGAAAFSTTGALVFSLEMKNHSLGERLLSASGKVNGLQIRSGRLDLDGFKRLAIAEDRLCDRNIFLCEQRRVMLHEIRSVARRWKAAQGKDFDRHLVVIDYVQLVRAFDRKDRGYDRRLEMMEISGALKDLAMELNAPVMALAQLNRGVDARDDKRPMMSDLKESGALEEDADVIGLLYRAEVYDKKTSNIGKGELILDKNRNGPTGTIHLTWEAKFSRFSQPEACI